ncbi:MAG: sigma-70 family RNA polymerase sigma factor [Elusimicrobia bacterium]|nr:sigma-70 family RNA polymerase sigma factor [Elusimicrobiota bacterium]MDE2510333.1 sigma-70 family RNA polymerase sigma factor [Elusimicrobiota bacterium]
MKKTYENVGTGSKTDGRTKAAKMLEAYLAFEGEEIRCFAYGMCRDAVEAQELVQETCYRALRTWRRYDSSRPLGGWMKTILRNAFTDSRRRFERRNGSSLDWTPKGERKQLYHETISDDSEGLLERLEREESESKVREAVARLKPRFRKVLRLCDAQAMSYESAARVLRIPCGTVRSRLHRARVLLRSAAKQVRLD